MEKMSVRRHVDDSVVFCVFAFACIMLLADAIRKYSRNMEKKTAHFYEAVRPSSLIWPLTSSSTTRMPFRKVQKIYTVKSD